ncbi:uncharacterized protein LOC117644714 [Thrips palmi]|uniref:Gustatory receptor n=1 Tax=Thrips palmi TaxID=161013 RepID=A0A6P8YK21_THRPL|nr:uncharacterized protein LOC117644714 [Thrips palmi]
MPLSPRSALGAYKNRVGVAHVQLNSVDSVPVSQLPVRVSFDVRNSTLLYALCVQAFVVWSCYLAFAWRLGVLEKVTPDEIDDGNILDRADWQNKYVAFMAMVHTICWTVTPFMWLESPRAQHMDARCRKFMRHFGHLLDPSRTRADYRNAWIAVVLCDLLLGGVGVLWWAKVVETSLKLAHYGAHFYTNALINQVASLFWFGCRRIRHVAAALADQLQKVGVALSMSLPQRPAGCLASARETERNAALGMAWQELDGGVLTPERVHEFQCGWQQLCDMNVDLVPTPLSLTILVIFLIVLVTFYTYSALEQLGTSWKVTAAIMTVNVPHFGALFLVYNSASRSAETIRDTFMRILQKPRWPIDDEPRETELQKFLEVVRWNSPVVRVGGRFQLTTSSFNAVIAAITTYVIVILQLQLGLPSHEAWDEGPTTPSATTSTS